MKPCTCSPGIVTQYQKRISGSLLARTIADLAGSERIQPVHLAEACKYRSRMLEQDEIYPPILL